MPQEISVAGLVMLKYLILSVSLTLGLTLAEIGDWLGRQLG